MKSNTRILVSVATMIVSISFCADSVLAGRTSTQLTPATINELSFEVNIQVDRVRTADQGDNLTFRVTLQPKPGGNPLPTNLVNSLNIQTSEQQAEQWVAACAVQPKQTGESVTYEFTVAARYAEKSTFLFGEDLGTDAYAAGHYYWFYLKDGVAIAKEE